MIGGLIELENSYSIKLFRLFDCIFKIMKINILFLIVSVSGLFIFSFYPSLTAIIAVSESLLEGDWDKPIIRPFFNAFKEKYWRSQIIGLSLTVILSILITDIYFILVVKNFSLQLFFLSILILILLITLIATIHIFPIISQSDFSVKRIVKLSFSVGMAHLQGTILTIVGTLAIIVISVAFPILQLTVTGSVVAIWWNFMYRTNIKKIQEKGLNSLAKNRK